MEFDVFAQPYGPFEVGDPNNPETPTTHPNRVYIHSQEEDEAMTRALKAYYYQAVKYPQNFDMTFSQFLNHMTNFPDFRHLFGRAVLDAEVSIGPIGITKAMENLAVYARGKIPASAADLTVMYEALWNSTLIFDADRWAKTIGGAVATGGVQAIGIVAAVTSLADYGLAAMAIVGGLIYFILKRTKR